MTTFDQRGQKVGNQYNSIQPSTTAESRKADVDTPTPTGPVQYFFYSYGSRHVRDFETLEAAMMQAYQDDFGDGWAAQPKYIVDADGTVYDEEAISDWTQEHIRPASPDTKKTPPVYRHFRGKDWEVR